jgi:hypothetical protein
MIKVREKKLDKVYNIFLANIYTKVNLWLVKKMAMGLLRWQMAIFMMDNGLMELRMEEESTFKQAQEHTTVDNGKMEKEMVMVYSNFLITNFMKEHFLNQLNMVTEYKNSETMIIIKVNIKKVNSMERVNIAGLMDHLMKEILFKDLDMDKEVGNLQETQEIFILEVTKTIKNADMVDTYGQMGAFMKVILKTI